MSERGPRPVVFVCVAMHPTKPNEPISKVIQAVSQNEAASFFLEQFGIKAQTIHGPFRPKRAQVIESTRSFKFGDKSITTEYNGWEVTAFFLKEPENHAYLIFVKRLDNQKVAPPKGTIIVPISELKIEDA